MFLVQNVGKIGVDGGCVGRKETKAHDLIMSFQLIEFAHVPIGTSENDGCLGLRGDNFLLKEMGDGALVKRSVPCRAHGIVGLHKYDHLPMGRTNKELGGRSHTDKLCDALLEPVTRSIPFFTGLAFDLSVVVVVLGCEMGVVESCCGIARLILLSWSSGQWCCIDRIAIQIIKIYRVVQYCIE